MQQPLGIQPKELLYHCDVSTRQHKTQHIHDLLITTFHTQITITTMTY